MPDEPDEPDNCSHCLGTGDGAADGHVCPICGGTGLASIAGIADDDYPDDPIHHEERLD